MKPDDICKDCGLERREHHHDGNAYGRCGQFSEIAHAPPDRQQDQDETSVLDVLPCDVHLPVNTFLRRGVKIEVLMAALKAREKFPLDATVFGTDNEQLLRVSIAQLRQVADDTKTRHYKELSRDLHSIANAFSPLYASPPVSDASREALADLKSHYSAWRSIMDDARETASDDRDDMDEKGWIAHEIAALDRVFAAFTSSFDKSGGGE